MAGIPDRYFVRKRDVNPPRGPREDDKYEFLVIDNWTNEPVDNGHAWRSDSQAKRRAKDLNSKWRKQGGK